MNLLAIDPGNSTGWALFLGYRLRMCGVTEPDRYSELPGGDGVAVIIETPQYYGQGNVDPQRLAALSEKVGALRFLFPTAETVLPRTWKGQLPKAVCHFRYLPKLDGQETAIMKGVQCAAGRKHDMLDAICLGLWRLKR